jgi:hypothetical protein
MRTGRRVGIGAAIEVKVESVEAPRGRVDLIAAADQGQDRRRSGRRQPGRSRGGAARRRR